MILKRIKQTVAGILVAVVVASGATMSQINAAAAPQMKVHYINVGQGDAIYIKAPYGEDILIDAGDEAYGKTVVDYLKKQGVKDIEHLIATHPDSDHIGGMDDVLNAFPVKKLYYPGDTTKTTRAYNNFISNAKKEKGCSLEYSSQKINSRNLGIKGVTAKFVQNNKDYKDVNDDSIVLFVDYNNSEFLFTGDLATESEKDMVSKKLIPDVDVLKVAHHGSKYASSTDFLKKATPQYSVISVGKNNYGHPTSEAVNRLKSAKSTIYRTDKNGNVVFTTDGNKISISTSGSSTPIKPTTPAPAPAKPVAKTAYWTPSGKSYHYDRNCRTLSRSKTIYSGTVKQSGKTDPCDICVK
jgi:competence protein ComEC